MKKKILIFALILVLGLTLTGCLESITEEKTEDNELDVVWKDYSNNYFGVKYPSAWNKISDNSSDGSDFVGVFFGNGDTDDDSTAALDIDHDINFSTGDSGYYSSEQEFYTKMEEKFNNPPENVTIHSKEKINFNGCSGYKVIYTAEPTKESEVDYIQKFMTVIYYKNNGENAICYISKKDDYNGKLGNEILESFNFLK